MFFFCCFYKAQRKFLTTCSTHSICDKIISIYLSRIHKIRLLIGHNYVYLKVLVTDDRHVLVIRKNIVHVRLIVAFVDDAIKVNNFELLL